MAPPTPAPPAPAPLTPPDTPDDAPVDAPEDTAATMAPPTPAPDALAPDTPSGTASNTLPTQTATLTTELFPSQCTDQREVLGESDTRITHLDYGNNENHCWRIECFSVVQLTWLEYETELDYDYVRIFRESDGTFSLQQTLHGTSLPPTL
eukprot:TRINITY_DN5736_c0_g1_i3.p1 TRINITY_DN5736_c0_g1~~TRINITY_DN5736_c0_g1_i3.p1  ORF type:complete len:160 (+),score=30.00 TRINITY_DN5736_c0_g1_i3:28-480(+)